MNQPDSEILTLDEVSVYLKAGKKTVYRLAQEGKIPGFKLGGTWRFRRSELDRWIAAQIAENAGQDMSAPKKNSNQAASPLEGAART
ncbi:helix-turn-helix domain-containing protein [Delftia tsuruhatensis]|jgi:excisionase family DNA binding protein|uniref:helix-turn-helix domain-containing protein n=1 Tax=Delftia tsuruhatensis TaxID=180282 RepID=UPI00244D7668|nr:helix-turn-helix domain-containing protein [Delftia tsuruhatensis]MDH0423374.1 helix-turn-helix domain-containing protein [Delftia tsuruhatensis]